MWSALGASQEPGASVLAQVGLGPFFSSLVRKSLNFVYSGRQCDGTSCAWAAGHD